MPLSYDLISEFVKTTKDKPQPLKESTVYGNVSRIEGLQIYVKLDGSDVETPVSTSVVVNPNNRVLVRIKNHAATITDNLDVISNAIVKEKTDGTTEVVRVDSVISNSATIDDITAATAKIQNTLETNYMLAEDIKSDYISAENFSAKVADLGYLKADKLESEVAEFGYVKADNLDVKVGSFGYIKANNADITQLKADVANIDTLMFGNAAGNVIQSSFANSVIATLGDAWIKSAMIESIDTSKVTIASGDDSLRISGNLIQFKDGGDVKMQLGKDAQGKYSVVLCDENGATLLDKDGIKANAVPNQLIVNAMVSDTADISASKLNIDSLFTAINGSTKTIKSSKVYLDEKGQTLDVEFKALETTANGMSTKYSTLVRLSKR